MDTGDRRTGTIFSKGSVHKPQKLETYYNGLGGDGFGEATTTTVNQRVGMLVVDIFSGGSKDLMWRGASEEDLSNSSEKNTKNLDKDIDKMFKDFPPKK